MSLEKFIAPLRPNFNLLLSCSVCVEPIALAHVLLLDADNFEAHGRELKILSELTSGIILSHDPNSIVYQGKG